MITKDTLEDEVYVPSRSIILDENRPKLGKGKGNESINMGNR